MREQFSIILRLCLLFFIAAIASPALAQDAIKTEETVIRALKTGDGQPIAGCLNDLCDLDLPQYKGTYSKAQAGKIIGDFFREHSFTGFRITRQGQLADKERYTIAEVKSGEHTYRIYFIVKDRSGKGVVPLFQVTR